MSSPTDPHIQQLPVQLANQIAAGEVVERPASVVKELLENSLDAGATKIEIDIEQGGLQSIRIQDDGAGIFAQDLPLALSRHATSKVSSLFDLEHLTSLGFRGEALPSIASVSRLQIITRRHDASQASRIEVSETGEVSEVHPAAHPLGTTVVVDDLFCNAPARRRFLRAAKTEFAYIQDVVQRIALARSDVAIQLRHNNRQVIKVNAATDDASNQKRMARIFGHDFVEQAYAVADETNGLRLTGFVAPASLHRAQTDRQYVYINGRVIKDRVLSHAIRQAYGEQLPEGRFASYCVYLEIDPVLVDVNVHPTKHEVRFRDGRNVHDFLFSALQRALQGQPVTVLQTDRLQVTPAPVQNGVSSTTTPNEVRERATVYAMPLRQVKKSNSQHRFGEVLSALENRFLLCKKSPQHWLIDTQSLLTHVYWQRLQAESVRQGIVARPLLLPERLTLKKDQVTLIEEQAEQIEQLGFDITVMGDASALLRRAPVILQQAEPSALASALLSVLESKTEQPLLVIARMAAQSTSLPEGVNALQTWLAVLLDSAELNETADWLVNLDVSQLEKLFPDNVE